MKVEREFMDIYEAHPCRRYHVGRNPSYRASVLNGLKAGIWWFPASLMLAIQLVILPMLIGVLYGVLSFVLLLFRHVVWLIAGVAGFLCDEGQS